MKTDTAPHDHRPTAPATAAPFAAQDTLELGDAVPGFTVAVAELFG